MAGMTKRERIKAALAEGGKLVKRAVMGGVEQFKTLHLGSAEEVRAEVRDAIEQMHGQRLIVTTGCTYPLGVPHSNLLAMRKQVDSSAGDLSQSEYPSI